MRADVKNTKNYGVVFNGFRMPEEIHKKLKQQAEENHRKISAELIVILSLYFQYKED